MMLVPLLTLLRAYQCVALAAMTVGAGVVAGAGADGAELVACA